MFPGRRLCMQMLARGFLDWIRLDWIGQISPLPSFLLLTHSLIPPPSPPSLSPFPFPSPLPSLPPPTPKPRKHLPHLLHNHLPVPPPLLQLRLLPLQPAPLPPRFLIAHPHRAQQARYAFSFSSFFIPPFSIPISVFYTCLLFVVFLAGPSSRTGGGAPEG